jgi:hypothetical protein
MAKYFLDCRAIKCKCEKNANRKIWELLNILSKCTYLKHKNKIKIEIISKNKAEQKFLLAISTKLKSSKNSFNDKFQALIKGYCNN